MLTGIGVLNGEVHQRGDHALPTSHGHLDTSVRAVLSRLARQRRAGQMSTAPHTRTRRYWSLLLSGALVALSSVGSVALTARLGADDAVDLVALRLLAYAAWLYALVGLPALLDRRHAAPLELTLAALRGVDLNAFWVRAVGLSERLLRGLLVAAVPGFLAIGFVLPSAASLWPLARLIAAVLAYLTALSATLGFVGALSERIAPRSSRGLAFSFLLVPFVLSLWIDGLPSVPTLFIAWFRALGALGVAA